MLLNGKRGQTSGGIVGVLVAVIAFIIILYILFLPPNDRAELLGEPLPGTSGTTGTTTGTQTPTESGSVVFEESVGRLDYLPETSYEHKITSFYLYKTTNSEVLKTVNPFYIKNGWFDKQSKEIELVLADPENVDNALMTFETSKRKGMLTITLNGNTIFQDYVQDTTVEPIELPKEYLDTTNKLYFEASSVGGKFWTTNEYSISNLNIVGDITDVSRQESTSTFFIEAEEERNIEGASLRFVPECSKSSTGKLSVFLNKNLILSNVPDCGGINRVEFSPSYISAGKNDLVFITDKGSYLMDQIIIDTELKEAGSVIYYFELDESLFTGVSTEEGNEKCGEIDSVCPSGCDADVDIDCCFEDNEDAYWCDIEPDDEDDRCINVVDASKCSRCPSGYEDKDGEAPSVCKGLCGDDKDETCPSSCSSAYDADCCFLNATNGSTDSYFCYDMPTTGLGSVCEQSVSKSECNDCPSGYENENGGRDSDCTGSGDVEETESKLKSEYDIEIIITFADDVETKKADIYINGHLLRLDTRKAEFKWNIDDYVTDGNNAIKIVPLSTLDIVKLQVKLK